MSKWQRCRDPLPCRAAGCSCAPVRGSGATGNPLAKDFENLAETLATFVALASIRLAVRRLARAQV